MFNDSNFIKDFLSKLNHPLEEVRNRALKNIFNKIERNILNIEDLCHYNDFIPFLLEWFNKETVNNHSLVLKLLKLASGTFNGAKHLLRVGGIDFLSQLRSHTKAPELLILINEILDDIFNTNPTEKLTVEGERISCTFTPKTQIIQESVTQKEDYKPSIGYFDNSFTSSVNNNASGQYKGMQDFDQDEAFKLSIHPIIPLTAADKKVLCGSLGTLQSDDFRVVISGMQFFKDVILEDFPAPVFLQRQGATNILIHFLSERQYATAATKALSKLCQKLILYIETCLDPNFFSTKNTYGIIKQDNNGYEEDNPWMNNDLMDLHYEPNFMMPTQLPVPVFCQKVISGTLQQFIQLTDEINCVNFFKLLHTSFDLLHASFGGDLKRLALWELWNLTEVLHEQLDLLSRLLMQYSVMEDTDYHRLSYNRQIYLGLFSFFWNLVSGFYCPEMALKYLPISAKVELSRGLLDSSLCLGLGSKIEQLLEYVYLFDQNIAKLHSESSKVIHSAESLITFFLHNNEPIKYADICISTAADSLECLDHLYGARFCKEFVHFFSIICSTEVFLDRHDMFVKCDDILLSLLKSSNLKTQKLTFMEIFDIVKSCLSPEELSKPKSSVDRRINFILRSTVYKSLIIYGLYNTIPEIQETSEAMFCRIWDSYGMLSVSSWMKVVTITTDHMEFLQPLADTSSRIGRQIMKLSLTFLEAENQSVSKHNLQSYLIYILPFCYNKKTDVRKEAYLQLEQFFRKDRIWECQVNVSTMTDLLIIQEHDTRYDRWFNNRSSSFIKSLDLEIENFQKVFEIYLSNNVDICVRKSAAEQLGIFLQMSNMHTYFINHGGLHFILDLIKGRSLDKSQLSILIPSTVLILLRVVQQKSDIRDTLRRDSELINSLFGLALYFCYDKQCSADISNILALIIFNSIIRQEKGVIEIFVPDILDQRLMLPFQRSVYKTMECRQSSSILHSINDIPNQKWCYKDSFDRNIRIQWNILKHGGLENYLLYKYNAHGTMVLSSDDNNDLLDGILESNNKLFLTENDLHILNNSIPQIILYDNLKKTDNATNHYEVQKYLVSTHLVLELYRHQSIVVNVSPLFQDSSIWMSSFKKFLLNIPSCSADYALLELTMDVLENLMQLHLINKCLEEFLKWIVDIIIVPNNSLLYSIQKGDQIIGKTDSRRLTLAKNQLELRLPTFFTIVLRFCNINSYYISDDNNDLKNDIGCIHNIILGLCLQRLKRYLVNPFDNLSMLLKCVYLMSACLEMKCDIIAATNQDSISDYCVIASDLIIKFQENREEGSITFMGTSVIHYLLKILINVLCCSVDSVHEKTIEFGIKKSTWLRKSPWLLELSGYRSVEIRAMSLALINRLVQYDGTKAILFTHCSEMLPESLWYVALILFCDGSEAPIVRSEAIAILQNLCVTTPLQNSLKISYDERSCHLIDKFTPIFVDHDSNIQYLGIEGLYKILLYQDFFRKVGITLTNFYTFPLINSSYLNHTPFYDPEQNITSLKNNVGPVNINTTLQQLNNCSVTNISTPMMMSSLMAFLCNLLYYLPIQMSSQFNELRINTLIMNLLDPKLLVFYLGSSVKDHINTSVDFLSAFKYSIKLIRLQISMNSATRDSFLIDEKFMLTLIQLLISSNTKMESMDLLIWIKLLENDKYVTQLQVEIMSLFLAMVIPAPSTNHIQLMITHLTSHIHGVFDVIRRMLILKCKKANIVAMQFLSLFSSLDIKDEKPNLLIICLENQRFDESDLLMIEEIMHLLLKKREKYSSCQSIATCHMDSSLQERLTAHNTLKVFLGLSKIGKSYVLKMGFIESAIVEIKYLHNKLDQCAQNKSLMYTDKSSPWKSFIKELIFILELLQNLFYDDTDAQNIGIAVGFPSTIYRLWTVALIDNELMNGILSCLVNFSADSTKVAKVLVNCHQTPHVNDQPLSVGCNISLIENLCRMTSADVTAYNLREFTVKLIFRLLANLAWCSEAVNFLLRSKFLDKYEQINPNQLQKTSSGLQFQQLWIFLLTSLSFTEEGQNALMKINGSAVLKILILQHQIPSFRSSTLLILRNLCTHPIIKVKLIVDGCGLIECINQCLDSNNVHVRQLVISSLKALLYSNKKIRAYLKSANITSKLYLLREHFENDSKDNLLADIITLINVLQENQENRAK